MSNITNLLDTSKSDLKIFKTAGEIADQLGYKAYIVGGYVRDRLLNKPPSKDIDITVDGGTPFSSGLNSYNYEWSGGLSSQNLNNLLPEKTSAKNKTIYAEKGIVKKVY